MTTTIVHRSTFLASLAAQRAALAQAQHLGRVAGIAATIRADLDAGNRTGTAPHPSRPFGEPVTWTAGKGSAPAPGSGIRIITVGGEPVALYPAARA